jgi:hypothetical protein
MNFAISSATRLTPRRLQPTTNEITKALYYHGTSVATVARWLYEGAELWNPLRKRQMEFADCSMWGDVDGQTKKTVSPIKNWVRQSVIIDSKARRILVIFSRELGGSINHI